LLGRLLTYDALAQRFQTINFTRTPMCQACSPQALAAPPTLSVVAEQCAPANLPVTMPDSEYPLEISVTAAQSLLATVDGKVKLIDVREPHEHAICCVEGAQRLPMRQVPESTGELSRDHHLLVMCHHGGRSMQVTQYLRGKGFANVTNIAGGIDAWAQEIEPGMLRY